MTDFAKLVVMFFTPFFICCFLLWLRRPRPVRYRGQWYIVRGYRNAWLLILIGVFLMLAVLMVIAYAHPWTDLRVIIGLMCVAVSVFLVGNYLTWSENRRDRYE